MSDDMKDMSDDMKDISDDMKDLGEILDTVTAKVPKLIKELIGTLYSPEAGTDMGKAVGSYYKGLIEAGIPEEVAIEMAKNYTLSFTQLMKTATENGNYQL